MQRFFKLLFCSALFLGCETTDPETDGGQESAKKGVEFAAGANLAPVFDAAGGSATVAFTSDCDWSVSASAEWISFSPAYGKASAAELSITLAENPSGEERTGTVTILSNDKTYEITVTQSFGNVFDTDATNYSVPAEGGTFTVKVATNMQYTVSISTEAASWLSVAETRAMRNETLTFTATGNTAYAERSATVSLLDADGNTLQSFDVRQSPAKCANNEILYTTSDAREVGLFSTEGFGANFVSNKYENGQGKIVFDRDITAIGNAAFKWCANLTTIIIPDCVTEIRLGAFWSCTSLTSINIPAGVTYIGEYAFADCGSLAKFEGRFASADNRCLIIDGVLAAFAPAGLTEYTIPEGVTAIGSEVFAKCSLTSITIPDGVTEIGSGAFYDCSDLTNIAIPDSVTSIRNTAFSSCSSLTSIMIPAGVTKIGDDAFSYCVKLKSITIPDRVTEIGKFAFEGCSSLASIMIPDGVTTIGDGAFGYCSSLTSVYCKPATPPACGYDAFADILSSAKIYVPTASVETYKSVENWSNYADKIVGYDF